MLMRPDLCTLVGSGDGGVGFPLVFPSAYKPLAGLMMEGKVGKMTYTDAGHRTEGKPGRWTLRSSWYGRYSFNPPSASGSSVGKPKTRMLLFGMRIIVKP
jgi:hypothetical protein